MYKSFLEKLDEFKMWTSIQVFSQDFRSRHKSQKKLTKYDLMAQTYRRSRRQFIGSSVLKKCGVLDATLEVS